MDGPYIVVETPEYKIMILQGMEPLDPVDDNCDVDVVYNTGERYVAWFFTQKNVEKLMKGWFETKEHNAKYFWAVDAIIVERLDVDTISAVVKDLIAQDEFSGAFSGPTTD